VAIPEIFKRKPERHHLRPEAVDPKSWEKTIGRRRIFAAAATRLTLQNH